MIIVITLAPLFISVPLSAGLDRCIGWVNLIFVVLSLVSMLATGPLGLYVAFIIAFLSRSRIDTDSATSRELKLMLRKIITFLMIVATIVVIYLFRGAWTQGVV